MHLCEVTGQMVALRAPGHQHRRGRSQATQRARASPVRSFTRVAFTRAVFTGADDHRAECIDREAADGRKRRSERVVRRTPVTVTACTGWRSCRPRALPARLPPRAL